MAIRRAAAREPLIEPFSRPLPGPRTLRADFGTSYAANGLIGSIFAATGPVAVILAVGTSGRAVAGRDRLLDIRGVSAQRRPHGR